MLGLSLGIPFRPYDRSAIQQMLDTLRRNNGSLWYVPDNLAGVYVDNVGTTPVTAVGDLVGLITDKIGTRSTVVFTAITAWTQGGAFGNFSGATASGDTITALAANGARYIRFPVLPGQFVDYSATITAGTSAGAIVLSWGTSAAGYISAVASPDTSSGPVRLSGTAPSNAAFVEFCIRAATSGGTTTFTNISAGITPGNHATQSAVASKPSVQRVPKRTLGPVNQLTQSDVSQWSFVNASGTATRVGNQLTFGASAVDRVLRSGNVTTAVGQVLTVAAKLSGTGAIRAIFLEGNGGTTTVVGPIELTGTPTYYVFPVTATTAGSSGGMGIYNNAAGTAGASFTAHEAGVFYGTVTAQQIIDNGGIPLTTTTALPNVTEWANVISFDGSNDFLQTGITTGNEGWVCAGVTFGAPLANNETIFANGAGNASTKGVWLLRLSGESASSAVRMGVGNGTALTMITAPNGMTVLGVPRVIEGGWTANTVTVGVDGQTNSVARSGDATPAPNPAIIGAYLSGFHHLQGPLHAIAYVPVLPSAADRATIRNGIAALQGRVL